MNFKTFYEIYGMWQWAKPKIITCSPLSIPSYWVESTEGKCKYISEKPMKS